MRILQFQILSTLVESTSTFHPRVDTGMKPVQSAIFQSFLALPFVLGSASAFAYYTPQAPAPFDIAIHTGMGTDTSSLQWSIASDPSGRSGPNVLSELTYRDVTFKVFNASADITIHRGWLQGSTLFVDYRVGQGTGGEVQDSDYNGNNRTQEYSRSLSSAQDSSMQSIEVGLSHCIFLTQNTRLVPALAFAQHQQDMVMTDGRQTVDTYNPDNVGDFRGTLNSTYLSEWTGAWAGVNWEYRTRYHELSAGYRYYWLDYHAEADWNLRSDFAHPKSFEHWANGGGSAWELSYSLHFSQTFSMNLSWYRQDWSTGIGKDTVYFADGDSGSTQLNEVTWESTGYNMGLQLLF